MLLQKVLQLYACEQLGQPQQGGGGGSGGDGLVDELLAADEGQWAGLIRQRSAGGGVRWALLRAPSLLSSQSIWLLLDLAAGPTLPPPAAWLPQSASRLPAHTCGSHVAPPAVPAVQ